VKVVKQDLFSVQRGIICHQVNNVGAFDAGIAVTFKETYPETAKKYREMCREYFPTELLGQVQLVRVSEHLIVANIFGQTLEAKRRNTSYDATAIAWEEMSGIAMEYGLWDNAVDECYDIYVPYLIGCGLGGGNWDIYSTIVDTHCPGVIACKL
jgi:O-acetyl-ADP-ribose deacetylase (regulator of RNase III)